MSFILDYFREGWNEIFGPGAHREPYKAKLRSESKLQKPSWLPLTPTKSHQAPAARIRPETDVLTRKCPHCKGNMYVNFVTGRITKPTPRKKTAKQATRYIKYNRGYKEVGEDDGFPEVDRSPTMKMRSGRKVSNY